jgi:FtsZ-interacting cell division protein ZipA
MVVPQKNLNMTGPEMKDFIRKNNLNKKHKDIKLSVSVPEMRASLEKHGYSTKKTSRKMLTKQQSVPTPKKENTLSRQKSVPVRSKPKSIGDAPKPKEPKKEETKSKKLIKIANIEKPESGETQYILKIATTEKQGFDPIRMNELINDDGWTAFKSTEKDPIKGSPVAVHLFKNTDDDESDVRFEVKSAFAGMDAKKRKILFGKK